MNYSTANDFTQNVMINLTCDNESHDHHIHPEVESETEIQLCIHQQLEEDAENQ